MTNIHLPFEDPHVWTFLRWNSYLSKKHKLLYIATPKVACTSLKWWFATLEGYSQVLSEVTDSKQPDPDLIIHDSFYRIAPNVTGLMPELLAPALVEDNIFRFAVVRNPYNRIFSAWQSKLLLREPFTADPYSKYDFFRQSINTKIELALAFEAFLEFLASSEAPNFLDYHWTPQLDLLRPDLITYNHISNIEDTEELKLKLAKHLGPHVPDPFAFRRANESLIPYSPDFLTKRAIELICTLYEADFHTFDYDEQPPKSKSQFSTPELDIALQAIGLVRGRHQRLGEMIAKVAAGNEQITARDAQIVARDAQIVARDAQILDLNQALAIYNRRTAELTRQLDEIYNSKAWHFIQLLRKIRSRITGH